MEFSFAVFFIITLTAIHSGSSLECYSCNSKSDPNCDDGEKLEAFKVNCNNKAIQEGTKAINTVSHTLSELGLSTAKIEVDMVCQKVDIESKDHSYTLRSCSVAKKDSEDVCELLKSKMKADAAKVKFCGQCKDSLCNSSSGITSNLLSIFIALAAVQYYHQ